MGGFNSGRHGGKSTTAGRSTIDVRKLQREGLLTPGTQFESSWTRNGQPNGSISVVVNDGSVNLIYRHGGDTGQDMDYPVLVDWTPCNYGGSRAWWLCPCCGRRVALLYASKVFSCRHCQRLAYASDRVAKADKPYRRANKLRERLGWGGGVANLPGDKPKGMHWRTYGRLIAQLHRHSIDALHSTDKATARIMGKLASMGYAP